MNYICHIFYKINNLKKWKTITNYALALNINVLLIKYNLFYWNPQMINAIKYINNFYLLFNLNKIKHILLKIDYFFLWRCFSNLHKFYCSFILSKTIWTKWGTLSRIRLHKGFQHFTKPIPYNHSSFCRYFTRCAIFDKISRSRFFRWFLFQPCLGKLCSQLEFRTWNFGLGICAEFSRGFGLGL